MSKIISKKDLDLVIESTLKQVGVLSENEACPECGATVCECGTSYMEEGDYMEEEPKPDFLDLDKDGDKEESMKDAAEDAKEDITETSINDLAESVSKTFDASFLTENMDNFNKLINYRNK
jgi:hypothetical protein